MGFEGDTARYVITPDGFADTGAVLPGEGTTQVFVTYSLPYSSGMEFAHAVNYPTEAVNLIMRSDARVTVAGDGLSGPMPRQMQTGETFDIYSSGPLTPGESLAFTLRGEPTYRASDGAMAESPPPILNTFADRWAIPLGGGILGVAMIAFGVWWRRGAALPAEPEAKSDPEGEWPIVLRAIADLDEARDRGEVAEEAYRSRRAELRTKARAILQTREAAR